MTGLTDQHIADVMQQYVNAMSAGDIDAIINIYAENAVVEDPVGSDPLRGHAAIRDFYTSSTEAVEKMTLEGNVRARGTWGACAMLAYPKGVDGMVIETLDVMEFNDDGKVVAMTAYWGDANMRML
ncbi:MAG: nuclear transport factor 2 family protein [Pseudomonadales bacterium]